MSRAQTRRDVDSAQQKTAVLQDHAGVLAEKRGILQEDGLHALRGDLHAVSLLQLSPSGTLQSIQAPDTRAHSDRMPGLPCFCTIHFLKKGPRLTGSLGQKEKTQIYSMMKDCRL